jgi:dynein heavy chain, axonemal
MYPLGLCVQEAKRFDSVDKTFMKIMADTAKNPALLESCSVTGRLETLQNLLEMLEKCQNSLSEYLDTKRCSFPRFYFISDVSSVSYLPVTYNVCTSAQVPHMCL